MDGARADECFGTVPRMVRASAVAFGTSDAVIDGDWRLTFVDIEAGMLAVARSLVANGIEPGDRVAVWAPNSADWICAALGVLAARAWLVPLNTRFKGDEAAYILDKTDAKAVFVGNGFLGNDYSQSLRSVAPDLRALRLTVDVPQPGGTTTESWSRFITTGEAISVATIDDSVMAGSADDVSDVLFTSGTTGAPKGVMLRHGATLRGYEMVRDHFRLARDDRYLIPTPFFHCFGYKAGWLIALMAGAVAVPLAVFEPDVVLATIERERITHMPGPPTMFSAILDHPRRDDYDLSSLNHAFIGAASIPEVVVRRLRQELGVGTIMSAYGLTENHALTTLTDPDDPPEVVATSVGRPLDGIKVRVVDDDGDEVRQGEPGELLLAGDFQMTGYFEDDAATRETIVDGWLHTGDVGYFDEAGYLHITDRKKDIYIVGGFNVAPAEVERALLHLDGVAQVAVVGIPDDYFGEVGAAFVITNDGAALTTDDVITYARQHLANYKVPRRIEIVDAFPLNATGKVLKGELRAHIAAETA